MTVPKRVQLLFEVEESEISLTLAGLLVRHKVKNQVYACGIVCCFGICQERPERFFVKFLFHVVPLQRYFLLSVDVGAIFAHEQGFDDFRGCQRYFAYIQTLKHAYAVAVRHFVPDDADILVEILVYVGHLGLAFISLAVEILLDIFVSLVYKIEVYIGVGEVRVYGLQVFFRLIPCVVFH